MKSLNGLLQQYCSDGVSYFKLGDLEDKGMLRLGRGDVISKMDMSATPGDFPVYSSSATSNGLFGRYGKYMFDDERITWSIDGGGKFFYRRAHKYSVTNVCGWLNVLQKDQLSTRFLYYVLISAWGGRTYNYSVKAHPSVIREDYAIPVPPIEVQHEIVTILDKFTRLEAELEAELALRTTQYEQYRYQLLKFETLKASELRKIPMRDLLKMQAGKFISATEIQSEPTRGAPFPCYGGNGLRGYVSRYSHDGQFVLIGRQGALSGNIKITDGRFYATEHAIVVTPKEETDTVWLFHSLISMNLNQYVSRGAQPGLAVSNLENIEIVVPSLEHQSQVSRILQAFDALLNDDLVGLPAEITARRKQYEYYRNKLLTFKELEAV